MHDVAVTGSGDDALVLEDRHEDRPAERAAEHHAGRDAQAGQGTGREEDRVPIRNITVRSIQSLPKTASFSLSTNALSE